MKIIFFTHSYPPAIGGVELTVERISRQLRRLGHEVKVITETPGAHAAAVNGFPEVEELHVSIHRPFTRLSYWKWMWNHRSEFSTSDVLHFHDYGTFIHWYFPLRFVVKAPVYAMTFHGFDSWPIRWHDRVFRRISGWCMDVTFGSGSYLKRYYHHRIDHTYVGAPLRKPTSDGKQGSSSFLFIGRLAEDTLILDVVRCLRAVTDETGRGCRLDLVGDGPLKTTIMAMASGRLNIHCHGPLSDPCELLADAGSIIATGLLAVLDAFSFEKPVIVPAFHPLKADYFSSIPDVAEKSIVCHDLASMKKELGRLLVTMESAELACKIRSAKAYADTLSWEGIARLYLHAYESKN